MVFVLLLGLGLTDSGVGVAKFSFDLASVLEPGVGKDVADVRDVRKWW